MCTELVNEGNAPTLSQLHVNETMNRLHSDEYGNQSNLQNLEPDSHSDQIQSQSWRVMPTAKIDGGILHLFQLRPKVILGDITVTRKM